MSIFEMKRHSFISGFRWEFYLKTTYGDPYYIGLNGMEIFDFQGKSLLTQKAEKRFKISADPPGVFILRRMENDKRRIQNLIDGFHTST